MASTGITISGITIVVVVALLTAFPGVSAQAPGPAPEMPAVAPTPDCMTVLLNLSDCLTFVEAGSNLTKPEKGCCPSLAGLVESNPICLCQLLGKGNSFGIELNTSKALALPSVCHVSTPDVSLCSAIGIPVGAPTPASSKGSISPGSSAALPDSKNGASSIMRESPLVFITGLSSVALAFFF